jgi:SAM-dependent methyltransferase
MAIVEKILRKIKQKSVGLKIKEYNSLRHFFANKKGLEIGGPSQIFRSNDIIPIYNDAQRVDGVNFSSQTIWENTIREGYTYNYGVESLGYQYILEASNLSPIGSESYDFVLSSHSLEHCANVLKTVEEWHRVLKLGGVMVVVVPDKRFTFDHKRPITDFSHLVSDFHQHIDEHDLTHLQEIVENHDIEKDPGAVNAELFLARSAKNYENRCLHHHVFDHGLMSEIFDYFNMRVLYIGLRSPFHIITIAQKSL